MLLNAQKLENFRIRKRLTRTEMAELLGYSTPGGYTNLIRFRHVPRREKMRKIAKALGCSERSLIV